MATENDKSDDILADNDVEPIDGLLRMFVEWANDFDMEIGITLSVNGCLLSGKLISGDKCVDLIMNTFATGLRSAGHIKVADAVDKGVEASKPQKEEQAKPIYIHLKDVRFFYGGQPVSPDQGFFWRGKLSSVDGFAIGSLEMP
jgi:hypothetical protein